MIAEKYRLGDLCILVRGTSATLRTEPGPYPLVVTAAFRRTSDTYQLEGPAVCVPLISSTGHGDAALHRVHYQEGKFALANLLVALLPRNPKQCNAKYLYYLLTAKKDELFVPLMLGTANVSLKEKDIASVLVTLPPLAEQRLIVARVETVATRVTEAQRLREEANTEADALLPSTRRHVFSALRDDPVIHLEDVCESIIDTLHSDPIYSEDGVPCVRSPDVREGWLDLHQALRTGEDEFQRRTARTVPRVGDVIYVRQGGGTGRAAVVQEGQRFSLGQAMMLLRPDTDRVLPRFLYHQLRSPQVLEGQLAPCYIGTASPRVNIGTLRQFCLQIPPIPVQRRIIAHLDALQAKADALRSLQAETAAELDALLPAVLAKAFAGEL